MTERKIYPKPGVNIRLEPNADSPIVGKTGEADVLEYLGKTGPWYRLQPHSDGTSRFIHESVVNTSKPSKSPMGADALLSEVTKLEAYLNQIEREIPIRIDRICRNSPNPAASVSRQFRKGWRAGGDDGIRTHDLLSAIQALFRAELRPHIGGRLFYPKTLPKGSWCRESQVPFKIGKRLHVGPFGL